MKEKPKAMLNEINLDIYNIHNNLSRHIQYIVMVIVCAPYKFIRNDFD